jgi:acyl-CoA synthetase (AMP-forming)/AMP-acid ligase II
MLIGDVSRRNAWRYPDKIALICGDSKMTWAAVDERANRLATFLLSRGLVQGDRVAVGAPNTIEWPEIVFGLAKAGLVLVPVNVRFFCRRGRVPDWRLGVPGGDRRHVGGRQVFCRNR